MTSLPTYEIVWCLATLVLAAASGAHSFLLLRLGAVVMGTAVLAFALFAGQSVLAAVQAILIVANALRILELRWLRSTVRSSREEAIDPKQFEDYFRRERHERGDTLFLKGNPGNYAYFVASGEVGIPEAAAHVGPGEFFGEFSLFTDGRLRTASAVCRTDVELYRIDAEALAATFHRNPDFAFGLVRLIVQRMSRNNERLSAENATLRIDRQLARPRVL